MQIEERIVASFLDRKGFHWAESILLGLKEELAIDCDAIPRIATPFGAGIGRTGMLCGVVSGSLMGLGLLKGRDKGGDDVIPAFDAAREFVEAFQEKFGNIECRALIGYDLTSRAQRKMFAIRKVKEASCRSYLEWAIARLKPLLPKGSGINS